MRVKIDHQRGAKEIGQMCKEKNMRERKDNSILSLITLEGDENNCDHSAFKE